MIVGEPYVVTWLEGAATYSAHACPPMRIWTMGFPHHGDFLLLLASDSNVPAATREIQSRKHQEESRPSVDAVREAHAARGGPDTATGQTRAPQRCGGGGTPRD